MYLLLFLLHSMMVMLAIGAEKHRIKMDLVAVVSANGDAKETQDGLLQLVNALEIDGNYARIGVVTYGDSVQRLFSLNENRQEVTQKLRQLSPVTKPGQFFGPALDDALQMQKAAADRTAVEVIVIVHQGVAKSPDAGQQQQQQQQPGYNASALGQFLQQGFLYAVYDSALIGEWLNGVKEAVKNTDRMFPLKSGADLGRLLGQNLVEQLLKDLCVNNVKICVYDNADRSKCTSMQMSGSEYVQACPANGTKGTTACHVDECVKSCDKLWPWQVDKTCDCKEGLRRQGANPMPAILQHCPSSSPCPSGCGGGSSTPANRGKVFPVPMWAMVVAMVAVMVIIGALACTLVSCRRRHEQQQQQQQQQQQRTKPTKEDKEDKEDKDVVAEVATDPTRAPETKIYHYQTVGNTHTSQTDKTMAPPTVAPNLPQSVKTTARPKHRVSYHSFNEGHRSGRDAYRDSNIGADLHDDLHNNNNGGRDNRNRVRRSSDSSELPSALRSGATPNRKSPQSRGNNSAQSAGLTPMPPRTNTRSPRIPSKSPRRSPQSIVTDKRSPPKRDHRGSRDDRRPTRDDRRSIRDDRRTARDGTRSPRTDVRSPHGRSPRSPGITRNRYGRKPVPKHGRPKSYYH